MAGGSEARRLPYARLSSRVGGRVAASAEASLSDDVRKDAGYHPFLDAFIVLGGDLSQKSLGLAD